MKIYAVVETEGPESERRSVLRGLFVTPEEAFECRKRFKEENLKLIYGELVVLECETGRRVTPDDFPPQVLEPGEEFYSYLKESDIEG